MSIMMIFNKEKYLPIHTGSVNTYPFIEYLEEKGIKINPYNLVERKIEDGELLKMRGWVKLYFDNNDILYVIDKYGIEHRGTVYKEGLTCKYKISVDKDSIAVYALEAGDKVAKIVNEVVVTFSPTNTKSHCKLYMGIGIHGFSCDNIKVEVEKKK